MRETVADEDVCVNIYKLQSWITEAGSQFLLRSLPGYEYVERVPLKLYFSSFLTPRLSFKILFRKTLTMKLVHF